MSKLIALPRPVGATVLSFAIALSALAAPASSLAAPPEGAAPLLKLSPSPATFPKTTAGFQSQTREFEVFNEGEAEASIGQVVIEGPEQGAFNLGGSSCGPLQPGQHCSVWISFVPASPGEKQAVLSFHLNGFPEQSFDLSGTAVAPQLTFTPDSHDFGLRRIYETTNTYFQLANSGEAPLQLNNLEIAGGSNSFWTGNSDCGGRWLAPNDTCSIEVDFSPHDAVAYEAELRANVNGSAFAAALSGQGGRALVEASENPADFGAETVGATGAVHTITLTNSGNLPAGFFIGIVAGGDAGSFRLLDESCSGAPLMPGGSCTAHIRFAPLSTGAKVARLAFFGESEEGTMVALRGEGIARAVTLLPGSYDFGPQALGTKSGGRYFVVRNDGSTPIDLSGAAISGPDLDQFVLAGDSCTGAVLRAGGECLVQVRFAPDSGGAKAATVRVGSDAGVFTVSLSGQGAVLPRVDSVDSSASSKAHAGRHRFRRFRRGRAIRALPHQGALAKTKAAPPRG